MPGVHMGSPGGLLVPPPPIPYKAKKFLGTFSVTGGHDTPLGTKKGRYPPPFNFPKTALKVSV